MKQATIPTKKCTQCKNKKPLKDFCRRPEQSDGKASICKECQNKWNKKNYSPVKEKWSYVF